MGLKAPSLGGITPRENVGKDERSPALRGGEVEGSSWGGSGRSQLRSRGHGLEGAAAELGTAGGRGRRSQTNGPGTVPRAGHW